MVGADHPLRLAGVVGRAAGAAVDQIDHLLRGHRVVLERWRAGEPVEDVVFEDGREQLPLSEEPGYVGDRELAHVVATGHGVVHRFPRQGVASDERVDAAGDRPRLATPFGQAVAVHVPLVGQRSACRGEIQDDGGESGVGRRAPHSSTFGEDDGARGELRAES